MALRYLTGRVGLPALRRASPPGPGVSGRCKAGYSNDAWQAEIDLGAKRCVLETIRIAKQEAAKESAAIEQSFALTREAAIKEERRREKIHMLLMAGSTAVGMGLALLVAPYLPRSLMGFPPSPFQ